MTIQEAEKRVDDHMLKQYGAKRKLKWSELKSEHMANAIYTKEGNKGYQVELISTEKGKFSFMVVDIIEFSEI